MTAKPGIFFKPLPNFAVCFLPVPFISGIYPYTPFPAVFPDILQASYLLQRFGLQWQFLLIISCTSSQERFIRIIFRLKSPLQ
jgi:hypothetical protein